MAELRVASGEQSKKTRRSRHHRSGAARSADRYRTAPRPADRPATQAVRIRRRAADDRGSVRCHPPPCTLTRQQRRRTHRPTRRAPPPHQPPRPRHQRPGRRPPGPRSRASRRRRPLRGSGAAGGSGPALGLTATRPGGTATLNPPWLTAGRGKGLPGGGGIRSRAPAPTGAARRRATTGSSTPARRARATSTPVRSRHGGPATPAPAVLATSLSTADPLRKVGGATRSRP